MIIKLKLKQLILRKARVNYADGSLRELQAGGGPGKAKGDL